MVSRVFEKLEIFVPKMPPSANVARRSHWAVYWRGKKEWEEVACGYILQAIAMQTSGGGPELPMGGEVVVGVEFVWPDRRSRDVDNYLKPVLDAGRELVYVDDGQVRLGEIKARVDRRNPGVRVTYTWEREKGGWEGG